MESTEYLFQMLVLLVMSVLVWAANIDVIADVFLLGNLIDGVTHFVLEDFCSTRVAKVQTKQPNMSRERGQWSRVGVKWDLVVSLIKIDLAEKFAPIEVGNHIVDGFNDVPFPDDRFVEGAYVDADSDFIRL